MTSIPPVQLPRASGAKGQLNFHQLYIFHAVASLLSFSRAAEALEITQPAVSIQVQELEKSMGVTLFHRRGRQLRITEVGEAVYAYAQQIFSLSNKLLETVQELQDLRTGHLALGASTTPGEYVLPLMIGQFRQKYPGIEVKLVIANTRSIIRRILDREMDLGIVGNRADEHSNELEMTDFMIDEIVLVSSPTHPVARQPNLTPEAVVEHGLVVREEGSATRQTAERHFASLGVTPRIALDLGSNQAVKQAVVGGGGVGVISRLGIEAELKAGMLTVLDVTGWNCRRPLTLVYPIDRYLSPSQRAFRDFLVGSRQNVPASNLT